MDERALIDAILTAARRGGVATDGAHVVLGPGDDAAVLTPPAGAELVWSTDDQLGGVHFEASWARAARGWGVVGAKAAAASLSDLAAMGATPLGALLALGLPLEVGLPQVEELAEGLGCKLAAAGCPLLGGNVARHPDRIAISLSVLGAVPAGQALRRGGGQAGDLLYVSGSLGWSRLGLLWLQSGGDASDPEWARAIDALLDPSPRLALGAQLFAAGAGGCMDLSDGLARDLPRLAEACGLQAEVDRERLPGPTPELAARLGQDAATLAWVGGEDYQLLVSGPPSLSSLSELTEVGRLVAGEPGRVLLDGRDPEQPGFDHFGEARDR